MHIAIRKKINAWVYFNTGKYWPEGAHFASRAVNFYSEVLGEYSWPQVSVVHSALSAGGGMEYPMITVINDVGSARELDQVITHEVGHNWLQVYWQPMRETIRGWMKE